MLHAIHWYTLIFQQVHQHIKQPKNYDPIIRSEKEDEIEVLVQSEKVHAEKPLFSKKKRRRKQKKNISADEPVTEPSIDNWFYKNFGIGKLFEEDDDQPLD